MNDHTFKNISIYIYPVIALVFLVIYLVDKDTYLHILSEDDLTEWITFLLLALSGMFSLVLAVTIKKRYNYYHWFFMFFFGFSILAGLEEISWGQRVFGIQSPEFFHKYNTQDEINLHNTFQGVFHIKTKSIELIVLFIYGVIMPFVFRNKKPGIFLTDQHLLIIPPVFLITGFLMGCLMVLDFPTGQEEEIGELFFSMALLFMIIWQKKLLNKGEFARSQNQVLAYPLRGNPDSIKAA